MTSQVSVLFYSAHLDVENQGGTVIISKASDPTYQDLLVILSRHYIMPACVEIVDRLTRVIVSKDLLAPVDSEIIIVRKSTRTRSSGGCSADTWDVDLDPGICYCIIADYQTIILRAGTDRTVSRQFRPLHESTILRRAYAPLQITPQARESPQPPPLDDYSEELQEPPNLDRLCLCHEPLSINNYVRFNCKDTVCDDKNPELNCDHIMHAGCAKQFWIKCPKQRNHCPRCYSKILKKDL